MQPLQSSITVFPARQTVGYTPFSIRQLLQYDLLEKLDKLQALGGQVRC